MQLLLFPNPSGSHTGSEPEPVGNQSQQGQRHKFLEAAQLPSSHQHRTLQIRPIFKPIFLGFYLGPQEQDKLTCSVHT